MSVAQSASPNPESGDAKAVSDKKIAEIQKSIGIAAYVWDITTDEIQWGDNFFRLMGFKEEVACATGREFETLLSKDSLNTRFGAIVSANMGMGSQSSLEGMDYQCIYAFKPELFNNGELLWIEDTGKWYRGIDGRPARAEGVVRIINERRKQEERRQGKTDLDIMTNLPNRQFLENTINVTAKTCFEEETSAAFLILNLERMDLINEYYGYSVGDEVLRRASEILKKKMRGDDVIARLGGAKFGMVLKNCNASEVFVAAKRFLGAVEDEVYWSQNGPVALSCSIGGCMLPRHADTAEKAIGKAIEALAAGRDDATLRIGIYTPDPMRDIAKRKQAEAMTNVMKALDEGRIQLAFQPVVDAVTHEVLFHESLLRMIDEEGNATPTAEFIVTAEKLGLIRTIDKYALNLAVQTLHDYPDARLSLNVSLKTAEDPDWLSTLACSLLNDLGVASRLIVEITESHAAGDIADAQRFVEMVRGCGCKIAIDDFGAGNTSFTNLRDLDADWIKLDGSFCDDLLNDKHNQVFIQSLIALAKVHEAKTVIEWVEDETTAKLLADWGADALQGNLHGKPVLDPPWPKRVEDEAEKSPSHQTANLRQAV